jgi:energy-coupling factor transport system substrate-specific component
VNWQVASLLILACALAAGFAWYERSRPSAKVVAVVGTLAALAALGRDAFAALPDVKPITAIVLVSGFAFGAETGFAVGAVGALASNLALGQGPWTPWQMFAWGLVGAAGGLLGRLTGRRLGRVPLALACALAAGGFNLILNLFTWTSAGSHTLAAYLVILGSAVTFDVTHVVASFVFGLAFGPALVRMLMRVRARLEVTWEPAGAVSLVLIATLAAAAGVGALAVDASRARAATAHAARVVPGLSRQVAYLAAAQNADGGFGAARGQSSSELYSAWTAMGLAAAGRNPQDVRRAGHSLLGALQAGAGGLNGAGDLERTILALHAAGTSTRSLAGTNPVAELLRMRAGDGSFSHLVNITAFGVFALRAAGRSAGDATVRAAGHWLARQQNADGGFSFATRGAPSDIDDTAAALQGMLDANAGSRSAARRAVAFLGAEQNPDGGFPLEPGGESNAQSTSWVIQALVAAGRSPDATRRRGSVSPIAFLHGLIAPDGSVRYSRTSAQTPVWVTAQALTALARAPFPIAPPPRATHRAAGAPASPRRAAVPNPASSQARHAAASRSRRRDRSRTRAAGQRRPASGSRAAGLETRVDGYANATGRIARLLLAPMLG